MLTPASLRWVPWMLAPLCWAACDPTEPAPPPDADADADADGDADGGGDGDTTRDADGSGDADDVAPTDGGPGPLTFIARTVSLVADRVCDIDGDGTLDNSIADLGSPSAEMTLMALNSGLQGDFDEDRRTLIHVPLVEDRGAPTDTAVVVIVIDGIDEDDPPDLSDDYDGDEGFYADPDKLDACGEPNFHIEGVEIDDGAVSSSHDQLPLSVIEEVPLYAVSIGGTVSPGGSELQLRICGLAAISELGAAPGISEAGELTMLELFLAGGAPLGLSMIPGFTPDLDLDGDGLEQVFLDADWHVVNCVDGDRTTISGRDCWADPRMADAFSLNIEIQGVPARFLGRLPGWERLVVGTCEDPPEVSAFDPV